MWWSRGLLPPDFNCNSTQAAHCRYCYEFEISKFTLPLDCFFDSYSLMLVVWSHQALGGGCTTHSGVLRTAHKLMTCYGGFLYCHRSTVMSCQSDHLLVWSSYNRTCQNGKCPTLKITAFFIRYGSRCGLIIYAFAKTNSCFNRNFS